VRIHSLEINGIGPYPGREAIDFEELNEAGVFVFSGPTGAGKSTILDAITFALFGEVPRGSSDRELVSTLRPTTETPEVVLDVTIGTRRLKIRRIPTHDRRHRRKSAEEKTEGEIGSEDLTEESQALLIEELVDGDWVTATDVTKTKGRGPDTLEDLLGMTAEQFEQVVLLPQGKFDQFLKADPADRQKLLKALFPGTELSAIEKWFEDRATADRKAKEAKETEIETCLTRLDNIVARLRQDDKEFPPVPEPPIDSKEITDWTERASEAVDLRLTTAEKASKEATQKKEAAEKALAGATEQNQRAKRRQKCDKKLEELEKRSDWAEESQSAIEKAGRALVPKSRIDDLEESKRRLTQKTAAREAAAQRLRELDLDPDLSTGDLEALSRKSTRDLNSVTEFLNKDAKALRELKEKRVALEKRHGELAADEPRELKAANDSLAKSEKARTGAEAELSRVRDLRMEGMAAHLAAVLEDGEPCSVCGSLEHPRPAAAAEDHVGAEEEKAAAAAVTAAVAEENRTRSAREKLIADLEADRARKETELKVTSDRIRELSETRERLRDTEPTLESRRESLTDMTEAIEGILVASRAVDEATRNFKESKKKSDDEISESGFADSSEVIAAFLEPAEIDSLKKGLEAYNTDLNETRGLLNGELAEVDASDIVDIPPLEATVAKARRVAELAASAKGTAKSDKDDFEEGTRRLPDLLEELAELRVVAERSSRLTTEINAKEQGGVSLTNFVLAERLKRVIEAANVHLARISDNQYQLRFEAGGSRKHASGGLGIKVSDSKAPREELRIRNPGTLSGGESFYTSLSLALGVALVVQTESGGRPIETLFIDEGFGSLDADTLDEVLTVIEMMHQEGRTIGLVSHVEEMKERITTRVVVTPGPNGSSLDLKNGA
jgi:exonuclease SbcC